MVTIYIDGKKYKIDQKQNLLEACLSLKFDLPYFCWHPALGSIGVCRQCAVKKYKNLKDTRGQLVMSCMTPIEKETYISINNEEAKQFRKSVLEWLMINHPHDCPVCEEGGHCHLQDMTVMTGHNFRRYRFSKRTHHNQNLGPFVSHEMNRCIACYRCIRYYRDYADGKDLGVYGIHDNIYFGRLEDGLLENQFSGNLIEICPTGVFTDKTHSKRYNRKWDMQFSPSICQQCSIGCNTSPGERYGELRRIENRYNGSVNHYFLCDRGRFGYGYVNLKNRPHQPLYRYGEKLITLSAEKAINCAANILRIKKVIGIGSPRASIESNFALRELVGPENFYTGISQSEQKYLQLMLKVLYEGGIYTPTLKEIESYDAILVLGEDVTQTGARVALAIRQAIKGKAREMAAEQKIANWQTAAVINISQGAKYPLFITNTDSTCLDDVATWVYNAPIEDQSRLGFAIAHALDYKAPAVENLDHDLKIKVNIIAQALSTANKPLVISGTNTCSIEILQAAANVAKALKERGANVGITMIASTVNSVGLGIIGGNSLDEALIELESGTTDGAIVLENDLYRHTSISRINAVLKKLPILIVIDHQKTAIMDKAHMVFSAASFAESDGTVINNEGRAQRFFKVYEPTYYENSIVMLPSWRWLYALNSIIKNNNINWVQLDHVIDEIIKKIPRLLGIKNAAPDAGFRVHGQKLAREPNRYSGRTAILANKNIHEPCQPKDKDTMFTFSMDGNNQPLAPRSEIPFAWVPGWNSVQAWNKFQDKVGGHLYYGDPGIRLIEPSKSNLNYFTIIPKCFQKKKDNWRVVPYYHLFGSEELSQRSPVFKSYFLQPYIKMNPIDAFELGFNVGESISFTFEGQLMNFPLKLSEGLTSGQVGLPLGMLGITSALAGAYLSNLRKIST